MNPEESLALRVGTSDPGLGHIAMLRAASPCRETGRLGVAGCDMTKINLYLKIRFYISQPPTVLFAPCIRSSACKLQSEVWWSEW